MGWFGGSGDPSTPLRPNGGVLRPSEEDIPTSPEREGYPPSIIPIQRRRDRGSNYAAELFGFGGSPGTEDGEGEINSWKDVQETFYAEVKQATEPFVTFTNWLESLWNGEEDHPSDDAPPGYEGEGRRYRRVRNGETGHHRLVRCSDSSFDLPVEGESPILAGRPAYGGGGGPGYPNAPGMGGSGFMRVVDEATHEVHWIPPPYGGIPVVGGVERLHPAASDPHLALGGVDEMRGGGLLPVVVQQQRSDDRNADVKSILSSIHSFPDLRYLTGFALSEDVSESTSESIRRHTICLGELYLRQYLDDTFTDYMAIAPHHPSQSSHLLSPTYDSPPPPYDADSNPAYGPPQRRQFPLLPPKSTSPPHYFEENYTTLPYTNNPPPDFLNFTSSNFASRMMYPPPDTFPSGGSAPWQQPTAAAGRPVGRQFSAPTTDPPPMDPAATAPRGHSPATTTMMQRHAHDQQAFAQQQNQRRRSMTTGDLPHASELDAGNSPPAASVSAVRLYSQAEIQKIRQFVAKVYKISIEGWLEKRNPSGWGYKTRFVRVKRFCLTYQKNPYDSETLGTLKLDTARWTTEKGQDANVFIMKAENDARVYTWRLPASSDQSRDTWMEILRKHIKACAFIRQLKDVVDCRSVSQP